MRGLRRRDTYSIYGKMCVLSPLFFNLRFGSGVECVFYGCRFMNNWGSAANQLLLDTILETALEGHCLALTNI